MTRSYSSPAFALPLPITHMALQTADRFARQQPTPQKAAQVRLNTIAVSVVNDYLQLMGIATHLLDSDSWNPLMQLCADVADLEIAELGKLECRPMAANWVADQLLCAVPPEVWQDRIGYVVVAIDESSRSATLLGFAAQAAETLSPSQLQPPEALLERLEALRHPTIMAERGKAAIVNLSQWWQNQVEAGWQTGWQAGWQTVESLLRPAELSYGFRSIEAAPSSNLIRRAKLIDLAICLPDPVALVVELEPSMQPAVQQVHIRLQVHPTQQPYLPADLRLTVLDDVGNTFLEAQSRGADNYIQLQFSGLSGERFGVQVAIEDASIVEQFVI
jgi:hypothetical protein